MADKLWRVPVRFDGQDQHLLVLATNDRAARALAWHYLTFLSPDKQVRVFQPELMIKNEATIQTIQRESN